MAIMNGFIKIYRSLIGWEWYDDLNTTRLFIHLLLTVNYENQPWQGIEIKRGQRVTSIGKLAQETGLSYQNIRTSISRLKSTGEITIKSTNKYTLITVENYGLYQDSDIKVTRKPTSKPTDKQQATNNNERNKEGKEVYTAEFELFFSLYPNAKEKQRTFTNWRTVLKNYAAEDLIQAAKNYSEEVKGRQKEYIKTSANFLGKEKLFLDYVHQTKQIPAKREIRVQEVDRN